MADKEVLIRLKAQDEASASVKSIKQELKAAQNELAGVVDKFGLASKEAAAAAQKVAKLKDTIGDAKTLADGFNPDEKFKAFGTALQGVTSGFAALQGVQGLFGENSKELEKTLLKVQSAMALSQGLNGIMAAKDSFAVLANVIRTNVVAAFTTLRGALISTGIGALAVGLGMLVANFDKVKKAVLNLIPGLSSVASFISGVIDSITDFIGITSEAERATEKLVKNTEKEIKATEEFLDANGDKYDQYTQRKIKANLEYKKHLVEINNDETKSEKEKLDLLKQYRDKANREIDAADADRKAAADKAEDERLEKQKKKYEEYKKKIQEEDEFWAKVRMEWAVSEFNRETKRINDLNAKKDEQAQKDVDNQQVQFDIYNDTAELAEKLTGTVKKQIDERGQLREWELEDQKLKLQAYSGLLDALSNAVGQQTAVGKSLAIASATINTYQAANEALKANYGIFGPAAQIARILTVTAVIAQGLQNIRKIASVQIPGKGGGGGAVGAAPVAPAIQTTASVTQLDQNSINAVGNKSVRAYVVDRDIRDNADRNQRIERAAAIGG